MELLVVAVLGLLGIAAASAVGPRLRVAAPLLLVVVGIAVSFLPFVPDVEIDPEWILAGVLPPLLYAASVAMPSMEFRREFGAIGGLSVLLVVLTSVVLGFLFSFLVPGLGLAGGIALGAIVSPTDAVATSIVKRVGVTPRVVTVLEGESLLNDATALVLLRSAIAATAASVTFWDVAGDFLFAVAVAVAIGYLVGRLNLWVRARVTDATVNTVISFTVPFLASVPAEALGASGLVAAVVAGLVTGRGAIRVLRPQHRMSDANSWRAIEFVLEGAVFLVMGLEMSKIVADLAGGELRAEHGLGVALLALVVVLVVRALYVLPTLALIGSRTRRAAALRPRLDEAQRRLDERAVDALAAEGADDEAHDRLARGPGAGDPRLERAREERVRWFRFRLKRKVADLDYFLAEPLGWREGSVIVWAGMRGAVTLAAAQTLPHDTPSRSFLVFVAFCVAGISLLVQGGTLPWLVRVVKPSGVDRAAQAAEREQILKLLRRVAEDVVARQTADGATADAPDRTSGHAAGGASGTGADGASGTGDHGASEPANAAQRARTLRDRRRIDRVEIITAQRDALLEARSEGVFSSTMLGWALETLDAEQISIELRAAADDD